jgi:hypothetical protein
MNKIFSLFLITVLCLYLVGCNTDDEESEDATNENKIVNTLDPKIDNPDEQKQVNAEGYFNVKVEDNFDILYEELEYSYKAGSTVTVKLKFHSGPAVGILVDGEEIRPKSAIVWEYELCEFIMPDHDVNVQTTFNGYSTRP